MFMKWLFDLRRLLAMHYCSRSAWLSLIGGQLLANYQMSFSTPQWVPYDNHASVTTMVFPSVTYAYNSLMVFVNFVVCFFVLFFLSQTNFFFPRLTLIGHSAAWVFNQGISHPHSQIQQPLTSGKHARLHARPPAGTGPASPCIYFPRIVAKILSSRTISPASVFP